jgi:HPt (histidine-containing phosphotransfer) domain-containing protein
MSESLFEHIPGLDTEYLDAAYSGDAETAAMVFEQYLQDLPSNLDLLHTSFETGDIEGFRHHIHKQKPGFSYVGLTDVTATFQDLQVKCLTKDDLARFKPEIEQVFARIHSSAELIEQTLKRLQNQ